MVTLTIEIPNDETGVVKAIADMVKSVKGSKIIIDNDDDGLTENELHSINRSLKKASLIKKGELKPLSMKDLWN